MPRMQRQLAGAARILQETVLGQCAESKGTRHADRRAGQRVPGGSDTGELRGRCLRTYGRGCDQHSRRGAQVDSHADLRLAALTQLYNVVVDAPLQFRVLLRTLAYAKAANLAGMLAPVVKARALSRNVSHSDHE